MCQKVVSEGVCDSFLVDEETVMRGGGRSKYHYKRAKWRFAGMPMMAQH